MYVESSAPRRPGDKAWMISDPQSDLTPQCMTFYYSMYGADVGNLSVYAMTGNSLPTTPIWTQSGNQGNQWQMAQTSIQPTTTYRVGGFFFSGNEENDKLFQKISSRFSISRISKRCPSLYLYVSVVLFSYPILYFIFTIITACV